MAVSRDRGTRFNKKHLHHLEYLTDGLTIFDVNCLKKLTNKSHTRTLATLRKPQTTKSQNHITCHYLKRKAVGRRHRFSKDCGASPGNPSSNKVPFVSQDT